jgi:hypothetical protein
MRRFAIHRSVRDFHGALTVFPWSGALARSTSLLISLGLFTRVPARKQLALHLAHRDGTAVCADELGPAKHNLNAINRR